MDFSSSNISCSYLLTILAWDLCIWHTCFHFLSLVLISQGLHCHFPLPHYFSKHCHCHFHCSLHICTYPPHQISCTHIHILSYCILQATLWKPHADMESLHITLLTNIFITESLGWAIPMPTHTPFYSPMVPTDYLFRSLQGVSILFTVILEKLLNSSKWKSVKMVAD